MLLIRKLESWKNTMVWNGKITHITITMIGILLATIGDGITHEFDSEDYKSQGELLFRESYFARHFRCSFKCGDNNKCYARCWYADGWGWKDK